MSRERGGGTLATPYFPCQSLAATGFKGGPGYGYGVWGGGLESREGAGLSGFLLLNLRVQVVFGPALEEDVFKGFVGRVFLELGFRGDEAVGGVKDDLFDVRLGLLLSML